MHATGRGQTLPWGEGKAEGGGPARGPLAQVAMVCSVWGTTLSSRRTLFSSTASCGSTVSRPGPVDAMAAFQRHLLGDDLQGRAPSTDSRHSCCKRTTWDDQSCSILLTPIGCMMDLPGLQQHVCEFHAAKTLHCGAHSFCFRGCRQLAW